MSPKQLETLLPANNLELWASRLDGSPTLPPSPPPPPQAASPSSAPSPEAAAALADLLASADSTLPPTRALPSANSPPLSHSDSHITPLPSATASLSARSTSPVRPASTSRNLQDDAHPHPQEEHDDGLSAVERAKRSAESFTMQQLARRKRKATSPPASNSTDDDAAGDGGSGGGADGSRESHRKYQKRLQKNRDSAFVSRIRRREYTRILESSLTAVEKEKDAALAAFKEMKRRFDIVSAELAGIKTAVASNIAGVRNSVVNTMRVPDPSAGFAFAANNHGSFNPFACAQGFANALGGATDPAKALLMGLQQDVVYAKARENVPTSDRRPADGSLKVMFMVAMVVGVSLMPNMVKQSSMMERFAHTGGASAAVEGVAGAETKRGSVWGRRESCGNGGTSRTWVCGQSGGELTMQADLSDGMATKVVNGVRESAVETWGEIRGERVLSKLLEMLQTMAAGDVEGLWERCDEGVGCVVREVVQEHGGREDRDVEELAAAMRELEVREGE